MAVEYKSFTEAKEAIGAAFLTINKPAPLVAGDLMVAAIAVGSNDPFFCDGWTQVQASGNTAIHLTVLYKIAGADEPANYTFLTEAYDKIYGFIMRFTGHDTASPINISGLNSGTSAAPTCPSVTTTVDNTLILRIFGADDDDITVDGGQPASHTVITVDKSSATSGSCSGGAARKAQATTGATGTAAFALTASEEWITVTVAITPLGVTTSASPSSSPSASLSGSPSSSPSASISSSPSASLSHSPSTSPSASLSHSPSASLSHSPSSSPSASISSSPSSSISSSPSSSISSSPSVSLSGSPSASPSASISSSPSASPSSSPSHSGSHSHSASASASPSASPSTSDYGTYTGGGTAQEVENTFVNLNHLEGETVTIMGTDVSDVTSQYDDETVSDSTITLIDGSDYNFVKQAVVGIPFRYVLSPMRMDIATAGGTTHGSIKKIPEIVASFYNTLGAQYGSSLTELRDISDFGSTLFTGDATLPFDGGFSIDDEIYISDDGPFPCTVRAIIPRMDKTGR